ncbi:hypothetical protein [Microseira wollei]|uniref:Uncharacterized protein n=1 Tax=Microseira wollei NIES-4236 TaxID=2530354 RepID=A0AAV3XCE8_9CYAN|nr:hypothetical protein [Microseira wollei]GET39888.1 hypothetical protein MiSe_46600 [Microseira wollei NIES-4236]
MKTYHLFLGSLLAVGVSVWLLDAQPVQASTITICNNSGENLDVALHQFGRDRADWDGAGSIGIVKGWYLVKAGECRNIPFERFPGWGGIRVYAQGTNRVFPPQSPPPTHSNYRYALWGESQEHLCVSTGAAFAYGYREALENAATNDGKSCIAGFRPVRFARVVSSPISINPSDMSSRNNSSSLPLPTGGVVTSCTTFVRPGFVFSNTHTWSDAPQTIWKYRMVVNSVQGNTWNGIFGDGEPVYGTVTDSDFTMRRDRWNQVWSGHCYDYGMSGTMRSTAGPQTGVFSFTKQ